jgi:hypothetical protein
VYAGDDDIHDESSGSGCAKWTQARDRSLKHQWSSSGVRARARRPRQSNCTTPVNGHPQAKSICAAGGAHVAQGYNFFLVHDAPPPPIDPKISMAKDEVGRCIVVVGKDFMAHQRLQVNYGYSAVPLPGGAQDNVYGEQTLTCDDYGAFTTSIVPTIWPIINHGQRPWYWEGPPRGPST